MADFDSSLPVRTQAAGDVIAKIADATTPAQQLGVDAGGRLTSKISDGTNTLVIDAGGRITSLISDGTNTLAIDAGGRATVKLSDGTDTLAINADGSLNVNVVSSSAQTENYDYNTAAGVAANGTNNHNRLLAQAEIFTGFNVAASGKFKYEVQTDKAVTNTFVTILVGFSTGAASNSPFVELPEAIDLAAGKTIRIIRTNRDNQAQDLYSTIITHA